MMTSVIIGGIVILVIAVVVVISRRRAGSSQSIDDRLNELAALGQSVTLEELELSQPFTQRVLIPMIEALSKMAQRFTPQNSIEASRHKLELAGIAHKVKPVQFLGYRMAAAIVLGIPSLMFVFASDLPFMQRILVIGVAIILGYSLPSVWVGSKISARQKEVIKALPDALDLLTICVEAGLGFDAAMSKVAEKWDNELSIAFTKTVQEMQLGKLRREALRNMANSMDVPDMTSFVAAIIQADTLGVSMAKVMRIQSDTMRMKRRQRAEEKARQAPVKMMFPLVFFIFPTIMIVLLGPAIIKIKDIGIFGGS
ncbi:MAG TPA: type II secretion system F family protein [Anaerolineae bacterium]|nr:type II secretion system F family protein [Anaerolineae bacterium]HQI84986.1 type II secretion system F family protein [Anaerolineae bacterium]